MQTSRVVFPCSLILTFCVLACWSSAGWGQTTFGSITGSVTDPSGAMVPGARITVTNEGTGAVREVTTAGDGDYTVADLDLGTYDVRVQAKGFSTEDRPHLILNARQVMNVSFQLHVGSSTTEVQVTGAAPVIDTQTPTLSTAKTSQELLHLPLTARQGASNNAFAIYNPGVGVNDSGNFFANGVRQIDTYTSTDGIVEMADPTGIGGGQIQPDIEGVSEITYITGTPNAEYESPVNFIQSTKSGTNQFHGGLYWDYNSSSLNARNFYSATVPFRTFNDFAASIGGPIMKDKLFFFADWEGQYSRADSIVVGNTPLPAWRAGDFSGLLSQGTIVTNPFTGQQFSKNQIPSNLISPVSQKLQDFFYPAPNFGSVGLQAGNWRGLFPARNRSSIDPIDGRIDYYMTPKDVFFIRGTYRRLPENTQENFMPPVGFRIQTRVSAMSALSWTHTFGPTLLNEARAGFSRNDNAYHPALIGSNIISQVGIQGVPTKGAYGVPVLSISGITGTNQLAQQDGLDTNFQFIDDLSWARGAHSMKFGFDAIRDQAQPLFLTNSMYGAYNFDSSFAGFGYADFLLGLPTTTSLVNPQPREYLRGSFWTFYGQDQWRVTPRLTVNYGLRYELQGPYYDRFGRISNFDPALDAIVVPDNGLRYVSPLFPKNIPIISASKAGYPAGSMLQYPARNFYPRIGVAYQLTSDGKTVIRAGYGIYGDTVYGALAESMAGGPFSGSETFTNSIANGVPLLSFPDPFLPAAGSIAPTENVTGFNPHLTTPYDQQWTVTLERQIGTLALSLGYVGSHQTGLLYPRNIDQPPPSTAAFSFSRTPFPALQSVSYIENGGTENYDALQVSAAKNQGHNLILSTGYTWARDLTDQLDNDWVFAQTIQNQFDLGAEYGNNLFTPINRWYADAVYSLPVGSGQRFLNRMPRWENAVFGGWRISAVATVQSGQFYTPTFSAFDTSNTNNFGGRADLVAGAPVLPPGGQSLNEWFNLARFKIPGCPDTTPLCPSPANIGRFGNAGNDILQTPGMKDLDLGILKDFRIRERMTLEFQCNMTDALNHPNFGYPDSNISDGPGVAGTITSTNGNFLQGSGVNRIINFALRLDF
ncbi:MAG: carboxypeptidase regulatory-like domain-containing protein [Terriglobia bacterium]